MLVCLFLISRGNPKSLSALADEIWVEAIKELLSQFKLQENNTARLVAHGYRQDEGVGLSDNVLCNQFARITKALKTPFWHCLFSWALQSIIIDDQKCIFVWQHQCSQRGICPTPVSEFEDPAHPNKVYNMSKALYTTLLHQVQASSVFYGEGILKILMQRIQDDSMGKDEEGEDVDCTHLYRFQVTPKFTHLHALSKGSLVKYAGYTMIEDPLQEMSISWHKPSFLAMPERTLTQSDYLRSNRPWSRNQM
ncbi:hypothetical protein Tco_1103808 [Tanacetum coccineum]